MTSGSYIPTLNSTKCQISVFILMGIPGLEYAHMWISIPFSIMYSIAVVANSAIVFIIKTEESLHTPMYLFLCMLAVSDVILINTTVPKALGIFWLNSSHISMNFCLTQMFFAHLLGFFESGVLALMALDRYIAICYPLRYSTVLTNQRTAILGLAYVFKSAMLLTPFPILVKMLYFCNNNIIAHTYCEHMSVAKLSCTDITPNFIYGFIACVLTGVPDIVFISFSYAMILKTITNLSTNARWKAVSTCTSHVSVMVVFYVPIMCTIFIQRYSHSILPCIHIIVANIYYLIPPMVNPIVYALRTQQIHLRVVNMIHVQSVCY